MVAVPMGPAAGERKHLRSLMPGTPIGEREREILTAIVETFIATGEPVGSRTLARSSRKG